MKTLERSRSDRIVLGVCGGFGRTFGIDADLVRAVWLLAILAGGIGVIPYIAAYFLIPEAMTEEPPAGEDRLPKIFGLLLIGAAGALFLRQFNVDLAFSGIFAIWNWPLLLPLALFLVGVFLVWPRAREAVGLSRDRKLRRSVSNRVLAGVAGGIANEINADANLVRLGFVLAAVLSSGLATIAYVLLVVILPEEDVASVIPPDGAPAAPVAPADATPVPVTPAAPGEPDQAPPSGDRS